MAAPNKRSDAGDREPDEEATDEEAVRRLGRSEGNQWFQIIFRKQNSDQSQAMRMVGAGIVRVVKNQH